LTSDVDEKMIYDCASRVLAAGLGADDSAFTPGRPVWTAQAAETLRRAFVDQPDYGRGSFVKKLGGQLATAEPAAIQLMAELIYLHLLLPRDIGGPAKRAVIAGALDLLPEPVLIPPDLDVVLDSGIVRAGVAYLTQRDRQLAWLIRLVVAWKQLPPHEQRAALGDPWAFKAILDTVPVNAAYTQRNVLLNLAFPDTFPAVVSRRHRRLIVNAFVDQLAEPSDDLDRDLVEVRRTLTEQSGAPVRFYQPPWVDRWRDQTAPGQAGGPGGSTGWLVRGAKVHGHNLIRQWLDGGYCSIAFPQLPELPPGLSKAQLDEQLTEALPDLSPSQRGIRVGVLDRFLNRIREGDVVVTVDGQSVYVGRTSGPVRWVPTPDNLSSRRRAVEWANPDAPLTREMLSPQARSKLAGQLTVSELGTYAAEFAALAGLNDPADTETITEDLDDVSEPVLEAELPEPTAQLADDLLIELPWLAETVDLLREKKQMVLYGPPGTGKTYLAQALAQFLTGEADGATRLVQFHPSYSYEDFFEGFRPRATGDGGIGFALEPGPLKQLVADATDDPAQAYILIIDEINRANLAKVFGELYFLLEYRDHRIQLQYSPSDEFTLPPNLYVIGTMNTADRSIALVDAAMRRRFYFQSLFPGEPPLDGMLRRWLERNNLPTDRADLLDELNRAIGDPDAAIGPSYLMTRAVGTEPGLARIWKNAILPLLQERHVGDGVDVAATYGIAALRDRLARPAGTGPTTDDDELVE
jgi:5-methylcytosine-specific restriction protein B